MSHRRFITVLWVIAAILVGAVLLPLLMEREQDDPETIILFIFCISVLVFAGYKLFEDWRSASASEPEEPASKIAREAFDAGMPDTKPPEPDDAGGLQAKLSSVFERVPLEKQVAEFAAAGLKLLPGRTVEELLQVWSRDEYEKDPYQCLLFTYAIEVEVEPRGRWFTGEGWNWDTECIGDPGSYVTVLRNFERLTGQEIFTELSDDARYGQSGTAHITYAIKAGEIRKQSVEINHDWADVQAVSEILHDVEQAIGDDRLYYAGDNGQAILVYFVQAETAARLNALKPGLLKRMF